MTSFDKLYQKYAVKSPILPPPPNEEVKVEVPPTSDEPGEKWMALLQESEGMDPLTEKPAQSEEELLGELSQSEPPSYEKELLRVLHPEFHAKQDMPTRPPPGKKKADLSPDTLLKMCSKYHDLCRKF